MTKTTWDYSVYVEPYLNNTYFYRKEQEGPPASKKKETITPIESLEVLIKHTGLKYLRMYYSHKSIYLYLPIYKCYFKITSEDLSVIVSKIFHKLSLSPKLRASTYVESLVKCAYLNPNVSYLGHPHHDIEHDLVAVRNGILNVKNGVFVKDLSPERFVVYHLSYDYDPDMPTPCFDSYFNDISGGVEEKKRFMRAVLYVVVRGVPELQVFYYFYGIAGTGKSTLARLASALVGDDFTHTTTFSALNTDQFEAVNIEGKKLILIGDSENYTRDLSQLKALTGGDPVRGRTMYANQTRDILLIGSLFATANILPEVRDSSGAIMRRIRPYKMPKVPLVKKDLIYKDKRGGWLGELASELPGILHFVASTPYEYVDRYIRDFHKVEALKEALDEAADIVNPLRLFVQEVLEEGEGAFLGYKPKGEKETRDFASRVMLYPTYLDFNFKRGFRQNVSHNTFTMLLMSACKELGIKVEKLRKPSGTYIKGIVVKPNYSNPDIAAGGPLDPAHTDVEPVLTKSHYPTLLPVVGREEEVGGSTSSTSTSLSVDTVSRFPGGPQALGKPLNKISPEARLKRYFSLSQPEDVKPPLPSSLLQDYNDALSSHSTKQSHANKVVMDLDEAQVVEAILADFKVYPEPSASFMVGVKEQVVKGVEKVKKFGCIPKTYKEMGISPRMAPVRYGNSINSTKKMVRNYAYRLAAGVLKEYDYSMVDVDLRAAYTSILLGLYPARLQRLAFILRNTTLWDSIKEDYRKEGLISYYDKPSVKVCAYASLFGGGKKAMFDSILEETRKTAGLTNKEFKEDEMFERTYQLASVTTEFMLRHPVVQDFRDLSKFLLKEYDAHWLRGPTGHQYQICEHSFINVFPCFLQSYEFALLAGPTLDLIKQYPQVEVIGHYHDGNVLAVPTPHLEEIIQALKNKVANLGKSFKLSFPIDIEVQQVFDPKTNPL